MACGIPVITSNTTSLPEVVGNAGITLPPTDVAKVSEALRQIICDKELRTTMRQKGLKQARLFSWEATARETLEIYKTVLSTRNRSQQ